MDNTFVSWKPLIRRLMRSRQIETEQDALQALAAGVVSLRTPGDSAWITVGRTAAQLPLQIAGQVRLGDAEVLDVDRHRPPEVAFEMATVLPRGVCHEIS